MVRFDGSFLANTIPVHVDRRLDGQFTASCKARFAVEHVNLVLFHQETDALVHLAGHATASLNDFGKIRGNTAVKAQAVIGQMARFLHDFRTLEQRFRRYTTDVQAHAAQLVFFDNSDLESELGPADGGLIAARPRPDNDNIVFHGRYRLFG